MSRFLRSLPALCALLLCFAASAAAQTTGTVSGTVQDEKEGAITGANVTVRNVSAAGGPYHAMTRWKIYMVTPTSVTRRPIGVLRCAAASSI